MTRHSKSTVRQHKSHTNYKSNGEQNEMPWKNYEYYINGRLQCTIQFVCQELQLMWQHLSSDEKMSMKGFFADTCTHTQREKERERENEKQKPICSKWGENVFLHQIFRLILKCSVLDDTE